MDGLGEGECNAVKKITSNGTLLPVLGTGQVGCSGLDGALALSAQVSAPGGFTFDTQGAMYVDVSDCGGTFRVDRAGRVNLFLANLPG